MKRKKVAKLMAFVALVGAVGVGGSLALLTAQTGEVTNTFTVGDGLKNTDIKLDETDITKQDESRTEVGNTYKDIEPDMVLTKDPQVHLENMSHRADSYVFVKVTGLDEFLNEMNEGATEMSTVEDWNNDWLKLTDGTGKNGIYVYSTGTDAEAKKGTVVPGNEDFDEFVFQSLNLSKDANLYEEDGAAKTDLKDIVIQACAVQATDSDSSWTNAVGELPEAFMGDFTIA